MEGSVQKLYYQRNKNGVWDIAGREAEDGQVIIMHRKNRHTPVIREAEDVGVIIIYHENQ